MKSKIAIIALTIMLTAAGVQIVTLQNTITEQEVEIDILQDTVIDAIEDGEDWIIEDEPYKEPATTHTA